MSQMCPYKLSGMDFCAEFMANDVKGWNENVKSARECWLRTKLEIDNSFKICFLRMECIVYMTIFDIKQL